MLLPDTELDRNRPAAPPAATGFVGKSTGNRTKQSTRSRVLVQNRPGQALIQRVLHPLGMPEAHAPLDVSPTFSTAPHHLTEAQRTLSDDLPTEIKTIMAPIMRKKLRTCVLRRNPQAPGALVRLQGERSSLAPFLVQTGSAGVTPAEDPRTFETGVTCVNLCNR